MNMQLFKPEELSTRRQNIIAAGLLNYSLQLKRRPPAQWQCNGAISCMCEGHKYLRAHGIEHGVRDEFAAV